MLKAAIIGNLGGDPEMRYAADGRPTLRMNVASNYRARTPEGEWQDRTEWVRVVVFGQRAETLGQHLRKGMRIYAEGRLEARPWTDRTGGRPGWSGTGRRGRRVRGPAPGRRGRGGPCQRGG